MPGVQEDVRIPPDGSGSHYSVAQGRKDGAGELPDALRDGQPKEERHIAYNEGAKELKQEGAKPNDIANRIWPAVRAAIHETLQEGKKGNGGLAGRDDPERGTAAGKEPVPSDHDQGGLFKGVGGGVTLYAISYNLGNPLEGLEKALSIRSI